MEGRSYLIGLCILVPVAVAVVLLAGGRAPADEGDAAGADLSPPTDLPRYEAGWSQAVGVYVAGDRPAAAEALARQVEETSGGARAQALFFLGCCRLDMGQQAAATEAWQRLLADHDGSPYCGDAHWRLARRVGLETSEGRSHLEVALERYPTSVGGQRAAAYMAPAYEDAGDRDRARRAWSVVLSGNGDESSIARARQRLAELNRQHWGAGAPADGSEVYVVRPGDSLWKIARKFRTTPGFLRLVNGMSSNTIHVGQRLRVVDGEFVIRVWKDAHILRIFVGGVFLKEYAVGLGSDGCTPVGRFKIANKKEDPAWYYDGQVYPFGDPRNILGTRWMGFENQPGITGYGIHGTARPESIGKNESSGCVRMFNHDVEELFELVPVGATVIIQES